MRKFDLFMTGSRLEPADISEAGWSVAIIEEDPFDGTCLNQGCIPSKMLIHCADVMQTVENAAAFGIHAKVESIDWQFIVKRAFEEVDTDAATLIQEAANVMRVKSGVAAINQSIYVHLALPRRCKGRSVNRPSDHNRSATCIW